MRLSLRTQLSRVHGVIGPSHPTESKPLYRDIAHQKLFFPSVPPDLTVRVYRTSPERTQNLRDTCLRMFLSHPPQKPFPHVPVNTAEGTLCPGTVPMEIAPPTKERVKLPEYPDK